MKYRARTLDRMDDASLLELRFRDLELPRGTCMVSQHMKRL